MAKRNNAPHTPLSIALLVLSFSMIIGAMAYALYNMANTTARQTISDLNNASFGFFTVNPRSYQGRFWIAMLVALLSFIPTTASIRMRYRRAERVADESKAALRDLAQSNRTMPAQEFLSTLSMANSHGDSTDFTGVYVLNNTSRGLSYVGQSVHVLRRVTQHLTGHGNGDVYADFKYGDDFTVCLIPLVGSGYQSLNNLERDMIEAYDAYESGYNRTGGNRT